ncbi:hypothetical protein M8J76_005093 [Diaphorina citri]|nr:hypothetical protein M8J75_007794 [Diaphorina citri]KAI5744780.1 hypothetical protein M8J76_005093 [Diaphorina citri]
MTPVIKTMVDLTPHGMKSLQCAHHRHDMMCMPLCTLNPPTSFKETVQYFQKPCLEFEKISNLFRDGRTKISQKDEAPAMFSKPKDEENKVCAIKISESELFNVLDVKQTKLSTKSEAAKYILVQNEKYNKLLSSQRVLVDEASQTPPVNFNKSFKTQYTSIDSDVIVTTTQNRGVDPKQYDEDECPVNEHLIDEEDYLNQYPADVVIDQIKKLAIIIERHLDQDKEKIVNIERFSNTEERINYLQERGREVIDDIDLDLLFTIPTDLGAVLVMDWHPGHDHLVAVAYGSAFTNEKGMRSGYLYIWNLNNSKTPERIYTFPAIITNMEFSKWKPHFLMITCDDGEIHVLEVERRTKLTIHGDENETSHHIVASNIRRDKMIRPVCATWYNEDEGETILCCKENGKIRKYTLKPPELERMLLMKWAPTISLNNYPLLNNVVLLNLVADNNRPDTSDFFYVATDEGNVHKMSYSLKETDFVYNAHDCMVTSFEFSPFVEQLFLTSSVDGTIKIWCTKYDMPLMTLQKDILPVKKAGWHPKQSTVIISVIQTKIQVWYLTKNKSEPHIVQTVPSRKQINDFVFSRNGVNLCVGDEGGNVFVYKILMCPNLDYPENPTQLQVLQLCKTVLSWKLPRPARQYLGSLPYPWTADDPNSQDEKAALAKDFALLKATYPKLLVDPIQTKTLTEKFEELFDIKRKGTEKRSQKALKKKDKCLKVIMKKLCRCKEECKEEIAKEVADIQKVLNELMNKDDLGKE